jgi:hypothetical protein
MSERLEKPEADKSLEELGLEVIEEVDQDIAQNAWEVIEVESDLMDAEDAGMNFSDPIFLCFKSERGVYTCGIDSSKDIKSEHVSIAADDDNATKEFTLIINAEDGEIIVVQVSGDDTSLKHVKLTAEDINDVLNDIAENAKKIDEDPEDKGVEDVAGEMREKLS